MINWRKKLSSRKFWTLLAALVTAFLVARGSDPGTIEHIAAIIGAFGACATYMLAEAAADAASGKQND